MKSQEITINMELTSHGQQRTRNQQMVIDNMTSKLDIFRVVGYFIFFLLAFFSISCGDKSDTSEKGTIESYPVTYSFFDVDVNSVLSYSLKSRLDEILGDHSTETRNTINLNINLEGFLKDYFPYFDNLNQRLNSPSRERVEHNTLKLAYRYAINKQLPFNYVEILFSQFTETPLLIRVNFKKDELNIIETLKNKYGEPRQIPWKEENGKSLCWEKGGDLLILSFVPDQFGNPTYEVVIYFAKRLEDLIKAEHLMEEKRLKKEIKSGKGVF